jgi:predicted neutral ceramidase superfamily lipid hydrolase
MYSYKQPSRQIPGIISYMDFFSTKKLSYSVFISIPLIIGFISFFLNALYTRVWNFYYIFIITSLFWVISGSGAILCVFYYKKKSIILGPPPQGWGIQMNAFFSGIIGITFIIGQILVVFLRRLYFQEVFFMLGTILAYIIAYVIIFSFTTVGKYGNVIIALSQPVVGIILYSIFTAQFLFSFFIRAIIFFCVCAFIFAIPYRRSITRVSNIYKEVAGIGSYPFIRAFVLSMMTEGNDALVEEFFDRVGINSDVKVQYVFIRNSKTKFLKGIFIIPHLHFGPFKTCGSSDLPAIIYDTFKDVPGITVYHTTNDHSQNLTTQKEVDKIVAQIQKDVQFVRESDSSKWVRQIKDVTRKISNNSKLIGTLIENVPIVFLTRHPLPSDDIDTSVGNEIFKLSKENGFKDVIVIDAHNSIIGDEVLIRKDSIEAKELIDVSNKFLRSLSAKKDSVEYTVQYGVAKDPMLEFSEKDGIGNGGLVVHIFKNTESDQKTAFIHFDGNNAFVDIRSYILNMLQNRGIERGEVTTSDSHLVARRFNQRGYSPIGDKIKLEDILKKLDYLIPTAQENLEEVEFCYHDTIIKDVRIWGDPKYFETIMQTLQECIRISQRLLTLSLIAPTVISLIIFILFYNIELPAIFDLF